jgi:hypothetical protein
MALSEIYSSKGLRLRFTGPSSAYEVPRIYKAGTLWTVTVPCHSELIYGRNQKIWPTTWKDCIYDLKMWQDFHVYRAGMGPCR